MATRMRNLEHFKQILLFSICLSVGSVMAESWIVPIPDWDRPPYAYEDGAGQLQGIDIALLQELSRRSGIDFEFKRYSFSNRQKDFISGKLVIDCCISHEWRITPEDKAVQVFTEDLYGGFDVFLFPPNGLFEVSDDLSELNDKAVGGMRGYTYVGQEQYGTRIDHDSQEELIRAVYLGRVDAGILERHVAAYYSKKLDLPVEFGALQHSVDVGIRIHVSKHHFLAQLNQAILSMKTDGTIKRLIQSEAKKARELFR